MAESVGWKNRQSPAVRFLFKLFNVRRSLFRFNLFAVKQIDENLDLKTPNWR